ncbi:MAG: hypothetical protein ACMXYK_02285 [Candidatus Woesearchaeota archaeon]
MNKKILGLGLLGSIPAAYANILQDTVQNVIFIGSLSWVTDRIPATKFAIFVSLLSILFWVLNTRVFRNQRNVAATVAFSLSAITVIFIPNTIAQSIGEAYSMLAVLILIAIPVGAVLGGAIYLTREQEGNGGPHWPNPVARHLIRFLAALIAIHIVSTIGIEYGVFLIVLLPSKVLRRLLQ